MMTTRGENGCPITGSTPSEPALTRREAVHWMAGLASVGLGASVGLAGGARVTAADQVQPAKSAVPAADGEAYSVDGHSHIWTRDVEKFPLAKGQTKEDLKPSSFTDDELMKIAQPEGVRRVVLIQHHIYHGWDNSYLIDAARRHPDRFRVVGMVDDTRPDPDAEMRRLLPLRVTGFRITSLIRGADQWLEGSGMAAMWRCAAETRQAMCCLINPEDLTAVDRMCEKYPDTPVVVDHFARIGMDGTMRDADVHRLARLARHKGTAVKISAYYALGHKKPPHLEMGPMIRRLLEAFGPQRLMWASDSPYQLQAPNTYRDSIALIRDRLDFLSASDREWLLRKTAERVYFFS